FKKRLQEAAAREEGLLPFSAAEVVARSSTGRLEEPGADDRPGVHEDWRGGLY
ncbi:unnamed protein product, partial [Amoebophrya sp. A120]